MSEFTDHLQRFPTLVAYITDELKRSIEDVTHVRIWRDVDTHYDEHGILRAYPTNPEVTLTFKDGSILLVYISNDSFQFYFGKGKKQNDRNT